MCFAAAPGVNYRNNCYKSHDLPIIEYFRQTCWRLLQFSASSSAPPNVIIMSAKDWPFTLLVALRSSRFWNKEVSAAFGRIEYCRKCKVMWILPTTGGRCAQSLPWSLMLRNLKEDWLAHCNVDLHKLFEGEWIPYWLEQRYLLVWLNTCQRDIKVETSYIQFLCSDHVQSDQKDR
jgi:hypothetical protein